MKSKYYLSASHIGTFKACPERFHLRYILGLKSAEDTESQRYGTNWHKILEIFNLKPGDKCPDCIKGNLTTDCPICGGNGIAVGDGMDAVIRYLDTAYAVCPMGKTTEEWETERITLLYSLIGYNWYHTEHVEETVVAQEIEFSLPLKAPVSQRSLPGVILQGRIDKLIQAGEKLFIKEHKSTSKSIEPDSSYWGHLALDTQTLLYPYAAKQLGYNDVGVLYDVWHRPTIRPKMLTQAESKTFVETGDYYGQKFIVKPAMDNTMLEVNDAVTNLEPGKKEGTFAIRETPEMFGARLLQDITTRPEFYFCTKEIARTSADLERFESELFNIYQTIRTMDKNNGWYCNEAQCEATFKCPFLNICYNHLVVDKDHVPEGFTCRLNKPEPEKKEGE